MCRLSTDIFKGGGGPSGVARQLGWVSQPRIIAKRHRRTKQTKKDEDKMVAQKIGAAWAAFMSTTVAASSIPRHTIAERAADPIVQLDSGLSVQGRLAPTAPTVAEFLGIPYAQPPVDDLRWAPPQEYEVASNRSVVKTTALPPSCWQYVSVHPGILRTDAPEYMIGDAGMSEDCLTMSIWAPAKALEAEEALPVLIWFYGGGFATGGIDVPYQIPVDWIERSQSHIVVSFK